MTVKQSTAGAQTAAPERTEHRKRKNAMSVAKGGGIVATGRLFAYGSRFVLVFLLARALGADQLGLYNVALSTATIVAGVAVFGLHTALTRYVAILRKQEDTAGLWGALQFGLGFSTLASAVLATGLFALSYVVADRIYHRPELAPMLQVMAAFVPFMTLNIVLAGATVGFKKMHYQVIAQQFVQLTLRIVLTGIMFLVGMKAMDAVIIFGIAEIVSAVLMVYYLNKEFSLRRSLRLAKHNRREILSFSIPVWISGLLRTFRSNIETILLGSLYTASGVGIYTIASRINLVSKIAFNAVNTSARPIIAEIDAKSDRVQLANIYQMTGRWLVTVNLPITLIMILYAEPILAIFGREFVDGAAAMRLLAVAELVLVGTSTSGSIIDMTGLMRAKMFNTFLQLGLDIGLNVLLIPKYGLIGAAVGTLVSISVINILRMVEIWYYYRVIPYNRTYLKPLLAGAAALAVGLLVGQLVGDAMNLFLLIPQVVLLTLVFVGVLLLLRLPEEEKEVVRSVRGRLAKFTPGARRA